MNFGINIKIKRIEKGISQKALANQAGISASYLCDIEKGRFVGSINVLQNIAKSLEVELTDIIKTEKGKESNKQ